MHDYQGITQFSSRICTAFHIIDNKKITDKKLN